MKIKKRYFVACIGLCVLALIISVLVFYLEMSLAHFQKLDNTIVNTWHVTSSAEPYAGGSINSDFIVTSAKTVKEANEGLVTGETQVDPFPYIGSIKVVNGKYIAYGQDVYGSSVIIYGDPRTKANKEKDVTSDGKVRDFGFGSRTSIYYKPDDPRKVATYVSVTPYIVLLVLLFIVAIAIIVVSRILNNKLKEDTFDDSLVNIMDIPILVVIVGMVAGFFSGMLIGNLTIGAEYTTISQSIVQEYMTGDRTIS